MSADMSQRMAQLHAEAKAIEAAADSQHRDFTAEELARITEIDRQFRESSNREARDRIAAVEAAATAPQPRLVQPEPLGGGWAGSWSGTPAPRAGATTISGGTLASARSPDFGFRSFDDFTRAVRGASFGQPDGRLMNAVTTYGSEGTGADGGFALPPSFAATVAEAVMGEGTLVSRLNPIPVSGASLTLPVDETTDHGTSGIYATWVGEGVAATQTKPLLKQVNVQLYKAVALVSLSDEIQADAPAVGTYVLGRMANKLAAVVNEALVNGNGIAKPLGFRNAPGLVTVAKEASQSAAGLSAANVTKMMARAMPDAMVGAFWCAHSSTLPELWQAATSNAPIYLTNLKDSPFGGLLGLPLVTSEYCAVMGTVGDILLVQPAGYVCAVKTVGPTTAMSIHWAFDQSLSTYRATVRIGGAPLLSAAVARKSGSDTRGHIVCVATRP